ncbi:MAG: ATP-binding protein [Chloroflexaceae bacterium]|nr:ATP-binding protein [Chloroflexaceae bacterium]NJL34034.1 ATP-binding protein [Chloroflexaceae bacterium]NJO05907.1 ATP-binding protein [Chloroflexaceae bacterium]
MTTTRQHIIEISFPSEFGYEVIAREAIATFARCVGFDRDRIDDLKTAVSEACINAIEHGNKKVHGLTIDIVGVYDGNMLQIDIADQGIQQYQVAGAPATIEEKIAGKAPARGMGLLLMTQLADEAHFLPDTNGTRGNRFRLIWRERVETLEPEH